MPKMNLRNLLRACALGAIVGSPMALAASPASAAVTYTFVATPYPDVPPEDNFGGATFSFTTSNFITSNGSVTPDSCTLTRDDRTCGLIEFDPSANQFGGLDDFLGFGTVDNDGGGSGTAFFFFQAGAFGAAGVYSNVGFPANTPCCGNAAAATLTVSGTADGVVPEPSSWALMILGFGTVGATLRRRRLGLPA